MMAETSVDMSASTCICGTAGARLRASALSSVLMRRWHYVPRMRKPA